MASFAEFLNGPDAVGTWTLVPDRSSVRFENTTMWGALRIRGTFTDLHGGGEITPGHAVSGRIDIKSASVDTGLRRRDDDLRSANFFDVARYAEIAVVVTGGEPADTDIAVLDAELTVKAVTQPLRLRTRVDVLDDGAVRLHTHATVKRKQFGVSGNMFGMVGPHTRLTASLVFGRATG